MAQPFIAEKGVLRSAPLQAAVSSRSAAAEGSNGPSANRASATPGSKSEKLPEGVTEQQVAEAQAKAANGDQDAIDWLKLIGVGAAVGTGYALHKVLSGRKSAKNMGADNISVDAASPNATTAVAKTVRKKPDLYIDVPEETVRAGYIEPPMRKVPAARTPKFQPSAPRQVMQAIRRLP